MRTTVSYPNEQDLLAGLPEHPEGGQWAYAMAHDDDQVSFADTAGELIELLIDGYDTLGDSDEDHDQALLVRYQHLLLLAAHYQAVANDDAMDRGLLDDADEDILTALYSDRTLPYTGGAWTGPTLYLMATDYAPYTDLSAPSGETVVLLDPARENAYLAALHRLDFISFFTFTGVPATV